MSWLTVKTRKGLKKVNLELRRKLHNWIIKHPQKVASPFANDELKIPDPENPNQKIKAGKLLLQVQMRELHNDFLSDGPLGLKETKDENGNALISDTALSCLRPPQVKPMTDRCKVMCGCKICITIKQQQESLNLFCLRVLRSLDGKVASFVNNNKSCQKSAAEEKANNHRNGIHKNGKHLHEKPKDAMKTIVRPFNCGFDLPHMKCTLRIHEKCPKCKMPPLEQQFCQPCDENDEEQQMTRFHDFLHFSRCTKHGDLDNQGKSCELCDKENNPKKKREFFQKKNIDEFVKAIWRVHQQLPLEKSREVCLPQTTFHSP